MKKLLTIILVLILTTGLWLTGCTSASDGSGQAPQVGKQAPDFLLPDLDGQSIRLSDFRGRPVLINFWASWCDPCRFEMPIIQATFEDQEWSDKGLVILTINIGESRSTVAEFMQHYRLSFPVLLDTDQEVTLRYNIRPIPTTFFIDEDGIIRVIKIGAFPSKGALEFDLKKITP